MNWIAMKDEKPTSEHGNVLVLLDAGGIEIMAWADDEADFVTQRLELLREQNARSRFRPAAVTHWMPLPIPPPKEDS